MCNKWRLEGGLLVCDCCHCHCHWDQVLPLDMVVGAGNSLLSLWWWYLLLLLHCIQVSNYQKYVVQHCLCAKRSLSSVPPFRTFLLCGLTPALDLIPPNPPPLRKTNRLLLKDHLLPDRTPLILLHLSFPC